MLMEVVAQEPPASRSWILGTALLINYYRNLWDTARWWVFE